MNTAARETAVLQHYPLVERIARKVHRRLPPGVDLDDLIGAGTEGLMEAVDRYDPSQNIPFGTYARYRIRGAVLDSLRGQDWVPRSVRRKSDRIASAQETLRNELGRQPTRHELASALDMPLPQLDQLEHEARIRKVLSLDVPVGEESTTPLSEQVAGDADTAAETERRELKDRLIAAVKELPERQRTAVALYYFHELTLKEVGQVLGVSESRACQLCGAGVNRLRKLLAEYA